MAGTAADFDVVVIGLGVIGSATLYHLARRGVRVLGIDRFQAGHQFGSSHGATRMIRLGHYESPSYVPLLRRAYALWRELEILAGRKLIHITRIAEIGPREGLLVTGTMEAVRLHDLPHEIVDAGELMHRYPAFRVPSDYVGVIQPDGGYIEAKMVMESLVPLAVACGACVRMGEAALAIERQTGGVRVATSRGLIEAGAAIVTVGPSASTLLPDLPMPLRVTRQVVGWLSPIDHTHLSPGQFPVCLFETSVGIYIGFPIYGEQGVKIAKHYPFGDPVSPDTCLRTVTAADEAMIRAGIAEFLPAANGSLLSAETCMYTSTPDNTFFIDHLPGSPEILVASTCCGHGFKFAPVLGEVLADLSTVGTTGYDISGFQLSRFRRDQAQPAD